MQHHLIWKAVKQFSFSPSQSTILHMSENIAVPTQICIFLEFTGYDFCMRNMVYFRGLNWFDQSAAFYDIWHTVQADCSIFHLHPLPDNAPQFVKDYYAYYKTERGYHPRSLNSNNGWNVTSPLSFMNMPILQYAAEIRSAVLLVHGEKAHSRYFSEGAYEKMAGDNKELLIIPGASHVDLYDNLDVIPFEKLNSFFNMHLK